MQVVQALKDIQPSYIREILQAASAPGVVSLAGGLPDEKYFPFNLIEESISNLLSNPKLFQYGETSGYKPLIEFVKEQYKIPIEHEAAICTGSQQALDLVARAFLSAGDKVLMEAPSYLGALQVFSLAQTEIVTIGQSEYGPNVTELERVFSSQNIKIFYGVPDFHNPTGLCWSLETRKQVAALCEKYKVTFLEDVPYRELRFYGERLPLVSSFCPDFSLVMRSFSKIATPGIRLGLVSGQKEWVQALIKVKQAADLHSSIPMQSVLLDLISHPNFPEYLSNLNKVYSGRYEFLCDQINSKLPKKFHHQPIQGGMFVWLQTPGIDVDQFAAMSLEMGVAVVPSSVFYPNNSGKDSPALRLNFTNSTKEELEIAADRLIQVIDKLN